MSKSLATKLAGGAMFVAGFAPEGVGTYLAVTSSNLTITNLHVPLSYALFGAGGLAQLAGVCMVTGAFIYDYCHPISDSSVPLLTRQDRMNYKGVENEIVTMSDDVENQESNKKIEPGNTAKALSQPQPQPQPRPQQQFQVNNNVDEKAGNTSLQEDFPYQVDDQSDNLVNLEGTGTEKEQKKTRANLQDISSIPTAGRDDDDSFKSTEAQSGEEVDFSDLSKVQLEKDYGQSKLKIKTEVTESEDEVKYKELAVDLTLTEDETKESKEPEAKVKESAIDLSVTNDESKGDDATPKNTFGLTTFNGEKKDEDGGYYF